MQCRFCLETDSDKNNPLISPCLCSGSVAFIHRNCLLRWVFIDTYVTRDRCSICKAAFSKDIMPRLEVITTGIFEPFLERSFLASMVHLVIAFVLIRFAEEYDAEYWIQSQLSLVTSYWIVFACSIRVRNLREYIAVSYKSYGIVLTYHLTGLLLVAYGAPLASILVASSMSRFWRIHRDAQYKTNAMVIHAIRGRMPA